MKAEIVAIGSELLLGQIVDTNSSYIAKILAENGIELVRVSAVGDDFARMEAIIKEAIARSPIVITTGGLGPTEDDLTREVMAEVTRRPLALNSELLEQIEAHFKRRGYRMTENNRKQALIPDGALPVENPVGTAPAFFVEDTHYVTVSLPGVPHEMKYLMEKRVVPYLRRRFDLQQKVIRYRVLRTCGLGESGIGLQIGDLMRESKNPTIGTLASAGDVRIRITANAESPQEASALIEKTEIEIRKRLGRLIYGVDDETLHGNVAKELHRQNLRLAVVETLTGGMILQKLTSPAPSSFLEGIVLPSEPVQRKFLTIGAEQFNALALDQTRLTEALSRKACDFFGTMLGLAQSARTTEIQNQNDIRIETSYSLSTPLGMVNEEHLLGGEASMIRERASIIALDLVRKYLLKKVENA
jgi:nicotinamide-nucleotide amidase